MPFDTSELSSKSAFCSTEQPFTAAMALALVAAEQGLKSARKRELLSALNSVVRFSGVPASTLVLSPPELRQRLFRHSAGGFGLSLSRWRSIKSALREVLESHGGIEPKHVAMDPAWCALLEQLDRQRRCYLLRLARYASSAGLAPGELDHAVFERFLVHLTERTLTTNPRQLIGAARSLWNRCHARIPGWPGNRIAPLKDPNQYVIPLHCFPVGFSDAVATYGARTGGCPLEGFSDEENDDELADDAEMPDWPPQLTKALRPATIVTRQDHLRWAASALVASGVPAEQLTSLSSLVSPWSNFRAIMRFLHARAGGKPSNTTMHVLETLRIIAKYEARLPKARLDEIGEWRKKVAVTYKGITRKNRQLVHALLEPAREKALLQLPAALMNAARKLRDKDARGAAGLAQRAIAIQILLSIPMRLKNLIGLRFDQHLQRPDPRRRLISHIEIPSDEAKADEPLLMHVSPALSDAINEWIYKFRPALAADDCVYVFPGHGTGNRSITPPALREGIKTTTARHVGIAIYPHGFRHLAAARYMAAYPDDSLEAVAQLLGHANSATTKRHYAIINNKRVFERFDALGDLGRTAKSPARERKSPRPLSPSQRRAKGGAR